MIFVVFVHSSYFSMRVWLLPATFSFDRLPSPCAVIGIRFVSHECHIGHSERSLCCCLLDAECSKRKRIHSISILINQKQYSFASDRVSASLHTIQSGCGRSARVITLSLFVFVSHSARVRVCFHKCIWLMFAPSARITSLQIVCQLKNE